MDLEENLRQKFIIATFRLIMSHYQAINIVLFFGNFNRSIKRKIRATNILLKHIIILLSFRLVLQTSSEYLNF